MMKLLFVILSSITIFISCQNAPKKNQVTQHTTDLPKTAQEEPKANNKIIKQKEIPGDTSGATKTAERLALTSNALQMVNSKTGSTTEITFGKPIEQMIAILNKILKSKVASIFLNSECGAGPLKIAVWENGLNVIFQEQKSTAVWQFAGWYLSIPSGNLKTVQTIAGIGIGSTREEMESAYSIKVNKTSLGNEFSTATGLYGIFDGTGKKAKITGMWSGVTCMFR